MTSPGVRPLVLAAEHRAPPVETQRGFAPGAFVTLRQDLPGEAVVVTGWVSAARDANGSGIAVPETVFGRLLDLVDPASPDLDRDTLHDRWARSVRDAPPLDARDHGTLRIDGVDSDVRRISRDDGWAALRPEMDGWDLVYAAGAEPAALAFVRSDEPLVAG